MVVAAVDMVILVRLPAVSVVVDTAKVVPGLLIPVAAEAVQVV